MARSFQAVCDRARVPLNDADKTGYPDADLLQGANDGILILRLKRPDLFFGAYGTLPSGEYVLADPLPVPDECFVPLVNYTIAWATHRDDEEAMQSRASEFYALFGDGIS